VTHDSVGGHFPPTAEEGLLLGVHDGHQVGSGHAAVQLGHLPAQPLAVVAVAEALELIPARFTPLHVLRGQRSGRDRVSKGVRGTIYQFYIVFIL